MSNKKSLIVLRKLLVSLLTFVFPCTLLVAQVSKPVLDHCKVLIKKKHKLYVSFQRVSKVKAGVPKTEDQIWLRFYNNSSCTVFVPSWDILKAKNGKRLDVIPDGTFFDLSYFIDGNWGGGDSIKIYPLSPGNSFIFSIAVSKIKGANSIEIPIRTTGDERSLLSPDIQRVKFDFVDLPNKVKKILEH